MKSLHIYLERLMIYWTLAIVLKICGTKTYWIMIFWLGAIVVLWDCIHDTRLYSKLKKENEKKNKYN